METELLISMLAWFLGSFVCGLCGLGAAIIAMPFMILVLPVQTVTMVSCLTALGLTGAMALQYMRYCRKKTVLWMALGAVPGALTGVQVLQNVSEHVLELGIGVLIIFCVAGMQFFQNRLKIRERTAYSLLTGFLGGLVGTCVTIDGPVVAIYGLLAGWNPQLFLGTTSLFFFLRSIVSCSVQWSAGLYTEQILTYALWCLPLSLLGFYLSVPLLRRINVTFFRSVVKVIIVFAGCLCLYKGLA